MLIVTLVIPLIVAAVTAALFIPSPGSLTQDEQMGIALAQEATAPCDDFGGLVSVYQGKEYTDAFSSVAYLGQGIVVAGKRSWNESPPNIAIYRSTDYGLTWNTVPNASGITGRHVYFFGQHDGRVFAGTGDEGNACLMRSDDYGATWSVVLTTADLKALAGTSSKVMAVFTPVYMGEDRWLANLRNDETGWSPSPLCTPTSSGCTVYFLESLDNGDTWHAFYPTGIDTSARKMILTSDERLLYAGFVQNHGIYVSKDGGYSFSKKSDFLAFSGMADLGNGVYLAGTYEQVTPPMNVTISIYKSKDRGETWSQKTSVSRPTATGYFRTIVKVTEGLVIAYASCSEFSQSDRCAEAYMSRDDGETWTDLGPAFVGPYGKMNAIYDTVLVKPGTFIATAQPDSNILRSINLPPIADAGPDQVVERTSASGAQVTLDGSGSCDPNHGPQPLSYDWTWAGGSASSVSPTVTMPMGTTTVTLQVSDGELAGTDTVDITVQDTTPPVVTVEFPTPNLAVQDGITLQASASDPSDVAAVHFYVREPDGPQGKIVSAEFEDLTAAPDGGIGKWEYNFDTLKLPDGYYVVLARAVDTYGNAGWSTAISFSIHNWVVMQLLPSTTNSKAGRTMPVKFALRVSASVDPAQPFVYNEELAIKIYAASNPGVILQTSTFGAGARDYRIEDNKLYITNFRTLKSPESYVVEIWRLSKNFMVASFSFMTVK